MVKTYTGEITKLPEDCVFVFGANRKFFHGAGAAGFASFGVGGNVWKKFDYGNWPNGTKGKWNVKGFGGFQEGTCGKSYAIITTAHPGWRRSIPLDKIKENVATFYEFAKGEGKNYTFLVAQGIGQNLNGYNTEEMAEIYGDYKEIPTNVYFSQDFGELLRKLYDKNIL